MNDVLLYDTTLRDGTQRENLSLSLPDKLKIAQRLDDFGIPYIEGGWPGSNPKDAEFFDRIREVELHQARVCAFGSTRYKDTTCDDDANIQALVEAGHLLVACGGGGIPVIRRANGELHGVEAVIDKDLTSALLAAAIAADTLVIVTGVESIYLNYGRPDQRALRTATVAELRSLANEGHFAVGSMLPKVQAVIEFLEQRGAPDARAPTLRNRTRLLAACCPKSTTL